MRHWLAGLICLAGLLSARAEPLTCVIEVFAAEEAELAGAGAEDLKPLQRLDLTVMPGQENQAAATKGDTTLAVEVQVKERPGNQWWVQLSVELTQYRQLPEMTEPVPTRHVVNTAVTLEPGGEVRTVGGFVAQADDGQPERRLVTVRLVP